MEGGRAKKTWGGRRESGRLRAVGGVEERAEGGSFGQSEPCS